MGLDIKEVEKQIKEVIMDLVGITEEEYDVNKKLRLEYGLSSVEAVELIMDLEDTYNIKIPDEEAENILTAQNAIDYVMKNTGS